MLTGSDLLAKVKELGDASKSDLVRSCGYVSTKKDGGERLNFTAFYEALLEAKGLSLGNDGVGRGKGGRKLSFTTRVQFNGNLMIGKAYTGKDADAALGEANITVNKNAVPNDPRSPFITSGMRVGTPAITTRGFGEEETVQLTHWMCDVLESLENDTSEAVIAEVKGKVLEICGRFPVYA